MKHSTVIQPHIIKHNLTSSRRSQPHIIKKITTLHHQEDHNLTSSRRSQPHIIKEITTSHHQEDHNLTSSRRSQPHIIKKITTSHHQEITTSHHQGDHSLTSSRVILNVYKIKKQANTVVSLVYTGFNFCADLDLSLNFQFSSNDVLHYKSQYTRGEYVKCSHEVAQRASGCVVKRSARRYEGRRFDT